MPLHSDDDSMAGCRSARGSYLRARSDVNRQSIGAASAFLFRSPGGDFRLRLKPFAATMIQALQTQNPALDLDPVEPIGVYWNRMKFQTPEDTAGIRARFFTQRNFQTVDDESAFRSGHGRATGRDAGCNGLGGNPGVRRQKDLRPVEFARRMPAAAQQLRQPIPLGLALLDPLSYIHPCLQGMKAPKISKVPPRLLPRPKC
jgi:hypothetical protein